MKIKYSTFATVLSLLFPTLLAAQSNTLAFSNGVFRMEEKARGDLDALANKLREYHRMTPEEFDKNFATLLAYNQTKCKHGESPLEDPNCLRDLYEAIVHPLIPFVIRIEDSDFWRFLSNPTNNSGGDSALLDGIFAATASILEPVDTTRSDLAIQLDDYRKEFTAHRKVVVVAHSQGNFFANDIYAELTDVERQSFGVVAVATPASFVAGGGPWTTFFEDFIWTLPLQPPPLSPNASNIRCLLRYTCHSFVESYLDEEIRDPRILPDIDATLSRLVTPPGGGTLGFANALTIPTDTQPWGLAASDFDGDGRADIAVAIYNHGGGDHLTVWHNIGTAGHPNFDLPVDFPIGTGPIGIAAGDLDNDGKVDLVSANASSMDVSVLRNTSTRGFIDFQPVFPRLPIFGTAHWVSIEDFDQDGRPDLIVTSNSGRLVSVFHHASDPNSISFDYRRDFGAGGFLHDVVVADIDRDTRPEILVSLSVNGFLTMFQNNSSPGDVQASAQPPLAAGNPPVGSVAVGDLDNDHTLDIVVAGAGGLVVYQNSSSPGAFDLRRTDVPTGTNADGVAIGDLDKDGLPDVVTVNPDENSISVFLNRSTGGPIVLTPLEVRPATGLTPLTLALADVDGDGWLDAVVSNRGGNSISILLNTTGH